MRYAFLGATNYSKDMLDHLVSLGKEPAAIFGMPKFFNISYSNTPVENTNYYDLSIDASKLGVPYFEVDSFEGKRLTDYADALTSLKLDTLIVLGWYYMIPKKIRELAKYGAWGIHASLLPDYAGGAPLVWAIINGEKKAGVTLFRFDDGVDDGDIIAQSEFDIGREDYIRDVYQKATIASKEILTDIFDKFPDVQFTPQDKKKIKVYPQRKPEDGLIDFTKSSEEIYNFVRAQSSPYPGAYFVAGDGRKVVIERLVLN